MSCLILSQLHCLSSLLTGVYQLSLVTCLAALFWRICRDFKRYPSHPPQTGNRYDHSCQQSNVLLHSQFSCTGCVKYITPEYSSSSRGYALMRATRQWERINKWGSALRGLAVYIIVYYVFVSTIREDSGGDKNIHNIPLNTHTLWNNKMFLGPIFT